MFLPPLCRSCLLLTPNGNDENCQGITELLYRSRCAFLTGGGRGALEASALRVVMIGELLQYSMAIMLRFLFAHGAILFSSACGGGAGEDAVSVTCFARVMLRVGSLSPR